MFANLLYLNLRNDFRMIIKSDVYNLLCSFVLLNVGDTQLLASGGVNKRSSLTARGCHVASAIVSRKASSWCLYSSLARKSPPHKKAMEHDTTIYLPPPRCCSQHSLPSPTNIFALERVRNVAWANPHDRNLVVFHVFYTYTLLQVIFLTFTSLSKFWFMGHETYVAFG